MAKKRSFKHPMTEVWLHAISVLGQITRIFEREQYDSFGHGSAETLMHEVEHHTYGSVLSWWIDQSGFPGLRVHVNLRIIASINVHYDPTKRRWAAGYWKYSREQEMTKAIARRHGLKRAKDITYLGRRNVVTTRQALKLLRDIAKIVKADQLEQDARHKKSA